MPAGNPNSRASEQQITVTYEHGLGHDVFGGGQRILIETLNMLIVSNKVSLFVPGDPSHLLHGGITKSENLKIFFTPQSKSAVINGIVIFIYVILFRKHRCDILIAFTSELFYFALLKKFLQLNFRLKSYLAAPDLRGFYNVGWWSFLKTVRYRLDLFLFLMGFKFTDDQYSISHKILNDASRIIQLNNAKVVYPGIPKIDQTVIKENCFKGRKKKFCIGYIGRINFSQKPLKPLFEALEQTKESWTEIHIVGAGPDIKALTPYIEVLTSQRLIFHGNKNFEYIQQLSHKLDLIILPSNDESFMLTAYEVVGLGVPIAVSKVADIKETLSHLETVFLIENNSDWLKTFIQSFDNTAIKPAALSAAASFVEQKFNWTVLSDELASR